MSESIDELLPDDDVAYLNEKQWPASVYRAGAEVHVRITAFPFPDAYTPRSADLLIRLPAGYPNANPDMFWTHPDVKLVSGAWPAASDVHQVQEPTEIYGHTPWQRWSRHFSGGWRPGVDGLRTYIGSIRRELDNRR